MSKRRFDNYLLQNYTKSIPIREKLSYKKKSHFVSKVPLVLIIIKKSNDTAFQRKGIPHISKKVAGAVINLMLP